MSMPVEVVQLKPIVPLVVGVLFLSGVILVAWGISRLLRLSPKPIRRRHGAMMIIGLGAFFVAIPGFLSLLAPAPAHRMFISHSSEGW